MSEIPEPLKRAWAAGVFDAMVVWPASGTDLIVQSKRHSLIYQLCEFMGVGSVFKSEELNPKYTRSRWQTRSMDQTRDALLFVTPFLSDGNKAQAIELLRKIERNDYWRRSNRDKIDTCVTVKPGEDVDVINKIGRPRNPKKRVLTPPVKK